MADGRATYIGPPAASTSFQAMNTTWWPSMTHVASDAVRSELGGDRRTFEQAGTWCASSTADCPECDVTAVAFPLPQPHNAVGTAIKTASREPDQFARRIDLMPQMFACLSVARLSSAKVRGRRQIWSYHEASLQ